MTRKSRIHNRKRIVFSIIGIGKTTPTCKKKKKKKWFYVENLHDPWRGDHAQNLADSVCCPWGTTFCTWVWDGCVPVQWCMEPWRRGSFSPCTKEAQTSALRTPASLELRGPEWALTLKEGKFLFHLWEKYYRIGSHLHCSLYFQSSFLTLCLNSRHRLFVRLSWPV